MPARSRSIIGASGGLHRLFSGDRLLAVIPSLIALVLTIPCFGLPFLWDDFDFLGRSASLQPRELLPDQQVLFYRPISREIYFGLLNFLGGSPIVGHVLNGLCLMTAIWLLVAFVRNLVGMRAAFFAGTVMAALAPIPLLVGWISGIQDLLAMMFLLATLHMELRGRKLLAPALFASALLAKETSIAFLPAILLFAYTTERAPHAIGRKVLTYSALVLVWTIFHPGVRLLLFGPPGQWSEGYLNAPSAGGIAAVWSGILVLFNVPLGAGSLEELKPLLAAALTVVLFIFVGCFWPQGTVSRVDAPQRSVWLTLVGPASLMLIPPLLVTSLLIRNWSPYYSCIPALGLSLLTGTWLARQRRSWSALILLAYVLIGVWCRTVELAPTVTTERNMRTTAATLSAVERGFKNLRSSFPRDAHVYVSVQVGGSASLYHHIYRYQPLRVWYREPSLFFLDPNRYRPGGGDEFLFWIDPALNVIEIDPGTLVARTSGPPPDLLAYQKTLRTFALGRAAAGKVHEAVRILTSIPGGSSFVANYDRRTAAAVLIASGYRSEAASLIKSLPAMSREDAFESILGVLHEPIPGIDLDDAAMEAFGLSPRDTDANIALMFAFEQFGFAEPAVRFALRVQALAPEDADAKRVLQKWSRPSRQRDVTVPIPHD